MKKFLLLCFLFVFVSSMAWAQERVVSGRVTAQDDGLPLPGVNVLQKGTTNGAVTDSDGNYKLSVPATGATLVFSFIGFASQEVAVGEQTVMDLQLSSDVKQLGEVVVTALGVHRDQKSLGYSVSKIDNTKLSAARTTNISNALTGKIAGLRVQGSNGMTGASTNLLIRGQTTFTGSNQPLFVVDGIPIDNGGGGNALQAGVSNSNRGIDLNQDDIETVSVLKGPSAAVLYGSRAAAGVILISTKKGNAGSTKSTVQFTTGITVAEVNKFPDYQNTYGQGQYGNFNAVNETNSWGPKMQGQRVTNFRGQQEALTSRPNNVESLFNRGTTYQNNISLSGGNGKASSYYVSYGNLHEFGILPSNELLRNSITFNGMTQFTDKFKSGINIIYTQTTSSRTQQGNQRSNPFFSGWITPRSFDWYLYPHVNPDGTQKTPLSATDLTTQNTAFGLDDNPFFTEQYNTYNDQVNRIIGNVNLSYDILPWLTAMYRIGTDMYSQQFKVINSKTAKGGGSGPGLVGTIQDQIYDREELSSYATLTGTKRFNNNDIGVRVMLGHEINTRSDRNNGVTGTDIQVIGLNNVTNTLTFNPFGTVSQQRLVGVFADISLDWKNSIFLGLTGRNDWSSTYSKTNNSYFYPAITTSILLTELIPALQDSRILSFLKVRANYASVGREAPAYSTDTYFGRSGPADGFGPNILYPFRTQLGQSLSNTGGAPGLKPEFNDNWEVGADVRFLNGKVGIDVNYFNNTSRDIIFNVPVAATSGFTAQTQNIGKSESKGWEIEINATPLMISGFRWDIAFNWSQIETKVLELAPGVTQVTLGGFVTPSTRLIVGQPYGVIFGSVMQRAAGGQLLVDGNGRLQTALDNQIIGNPNPKWFGGITNTFSYKGITLTALLDFRWRGDIYSRNISDVMGRGAAVETEDREIGYIHDGVLGDGTRNNIQVHPQDYFNDIYGFGRGEFVVKDGSWLRLREVSISYVLPRSIFEKTFIGKMEVGLNGRNLWLSAPNVPHIDPEVNAQGQSNSQGLEFNGLPQTRTYGAILKLTF